MPFSCLVCSELLEKAPGSASFLESPAAIRSLRQPLLGSESNSANVVATICGHVFHSFCLQQWMSGGESNNRECPTCRDTISNGLLRPLYPTICDDSVLIYWNGNVDKMIEKIQTLEEELRENKNLLLAEQRKIADAKAHTEITAAYVKNLEDQVTEQKNLVVEEQRKFLEWERSQKSSVFQGQGQGQGQGHADRLEEVQKAMDAVQLDVLNMGEYPVTRHAVDTLQIVNGILAKKLKDAESALEQERLRRTQVEDSLGTGDVQGQGQGQGQDQGITLYSVPEAASATGVPIAIEAGRSNAVELEDNGNGTGTTSNSAANTTLEDYIASRCFISVPRIN